MTEEMIPVAHSEIEPPIVAVAANEDGSEVVLSSIGDVVIVDSRAIPDQDGVQKVSTKGNAVRVEMGGVVKGVPWGIQDCPDSMDSGRMPHNTSERDDCDRLPGTSSDVPDIFHADDGDLLLNTIHVAAVFHVGYAGMPGISDTRGVDPLVIGGFGTDANDSQEVLVVHAKEPTGGYRFRAKLRT